MAGIRIRHEAATNTTYTLVDASRPYVEPVTCLVCFRTHTFKTYHIRLDDTGTSIVSPEVAARVVRPGSGFSVAGDIPKPPPQLLDFRSPLDAALVAPITVNQYLTEPGRG